MDTKLIPTVVRMMGRLLRLYPKSFRDAFAVDMLLTFRDQCRARYAKAGAWGVIALLVGTAINVAWEAVKERLAAGQREARIGAMALFTGGLLWLFMHTPFIEPLFEVLGMGLMIVPGLAVVAIFVGIATLVFQRSKQVSVLGWIGFALFGLGLFAMLTGYVLVWMELTQSGIYTRLALPLIGIGLFLLSPSLMSEDRPLRWPVLLFVISFVYCVQGAGLAWQGGGFLIGSMFWLWNIVLGVIQSLLWMALGIALWWSSEPEIGRIA